MKIRFKGQEGGKKKKIVLGVMIGVIVVALGLTAFFLFRSDPLFTVEGKIVMEGTEEGVYGVTVFRDGEALHTTFQSGAFSLEGLAAGEVLTFSLEGYEFTPASYEVSGNVSDLRITAVRPQPPEEESREVTLQFVDENGCLIRGNTRTNIRVSGGGRTQTVTTGETVWPADETVTLESTCSYFFFDPVTFGPEQDGQTIAVQGRYNENMPLYVHYTFTDEEGNTLRGDSVTLTACFRSPDRLNGPLQPRQITTQDGAFYLTHGEPDNAYAFESMCVFVRDDANQRYYYLTDVRPSCGVIRLAMKRGFLIEGRYISPGIPLYTDFGHLTTDSSGNFWLVAESTDFDFYTAMTGEGPAGLLNWTKDGLPVPKGALSENLTGTVLTS